MKNNSLEVDSPGEILEIFQKSFDVFTLVTRNCVRACNILLYNMKKGNFDYNVVRKAIFLLMNGFNSSDNYLRNYIHVVLLELSKYSNETKFAISYTLKDLDNSRLSEEYKNTALRSLFSILPEPMYYDFEKYMRSSILGKSGTGLVVAYKYFRGCKVPLEVNNTIKDYHMAYFNRIPVNRYSGMVEIQRIVNEKYEEIGKFLYVSTDPIVFFEACRALAELKPELASGFVERAVDVLRVYAKMGGIESYAAMKWLNRLSETFPGKVARANDEIEGLIQSPYPAVAMIAIVTLLRTGNRGTINQLATKLEPYMNSMPGNYRRMAIDTMEGILYCMDFGSECDFESRKEECVAYWDFIKKRLLGKSNVDTVDFKRYVLGKIKKLLTLIGAGNNITENENDKNISENSYKKTGFIVSYSGYATFYREIMEFLCSYLEDPEFYEVSMDILGILGKFLGDARDIVHVYNRLILDNLHVRKAAVQTLFDTGINVLGLSGYVSEYGMDTVCGFLESCKEFSRDEFEIDELGSWKAAVMEQVGEVHEEELPTDGRIKECRKIWLANESDFLIGVTKTIYITNSGEKEKKKCGSDVSYSKTKMVRVELLIEIENRIQNVEFHSGMIRFEISSNKDTNLIGSEIDECNGSMDLNNYEIRTDLITREAFVDGKTVTTVEIMAAEGDIVYGIFEYKIKLDEEVDEDHVTLEPFDINVFDLIVPCPIPDISFRHAKTLEMKYNCKLSDAASKIADIANMHYTADKNAFTLTGKYQGYVVRIRVDMVETGTYVAVTMNISSDNSQLVNRIVKLFE